ncbi:Helix-turn-helix domain protein [gamma proteobacterium HTCC5015]|nr:Helix-turn-helix domain protein [gamma proteobacterium HTCC5015]
MKTSPPKQTLGRVVKSTEMPDLCQDFSSVQLGKAITAKRTGMQLKLTDVASTLSISKPTLVKIEKGDPRVTFSNLLKVMEYLGLSFQLIADDILPPSPSSGADDDWF